MDDRPERVITGKDKLIVMPIRPADGKATGLGLGLHFLLGNLVCLHPGLLECWFGWRVKKIFDGPEAFKAYCRGQAPFPDIRDLGEREKVRFWLEGSYTVSDQGIQADLVLHDTREGQEDRCRLTLAGGDGAGTFSSNFIRWMSSAGLGYGRPGPVLWQENISLEGLSCLGDALEVLYVNYLEPGGGPMEISLFERTVSLCPDSYLAQDLLGWGRYKNGDSTGAREAFSRAVETNRDGLGALAGLMWCAVEAKDRAAALHYALEKARCRGGDPDKARAFVEKKFSPNMS